MDCTYKVNEPAKARAFFEAKLTYTTGPVELDRALSAGQKVIVVDVREHDDYAAGHIPGAINLPKDKWDKPEGLRQDMVNIIYCYSQACHLAACAAWHFAEKGYPVMELEGGFETWKKCDLEIEREHVNRLKRGASMLLHHHRG